MSETVWITLQQSDLAAYASSPQYAAITAGLLVPGQTGRFAAVMADVCSDIRAALRINYQTSALANSIPGQAKKCACYLIIEALQASISTLKLTDDQKELIKKQMEWLAAVKAGTEAIDLPSNPSTDAVQLPRGVEVASSTCRLATRETMRGL